ncbi:succinic semialdehyde dehydrogenase [Nocardia jiangsuensis]|uniref:Succinic semialdehyde dehydrogenase n=1 Tax=Nocardia jiangsuensis TaxID=1691563 RepID=A0ABV8DND1_9NOCA
MPVPSSDVLRRLSHLAAVADPGASTAISEVFTGRVLGTVPVGDAADVAAAFGKARAAQPEWAQRPIRERTAIFERARSLLLAEWEQLLDIIQAETGKARWAAYEEAMALLLVLQYYTDKSPALLAPQRVPGVLPMIMRAGVHRKPKGVVGVIAPWNYPIALSIGDGIPALIAGNAVVVKPDSLTPYSPLFVTELLYRAGLPRDLLAVVPGAGRVVGRAILDHCDFLMFTGSSATGRTLAEECGRRLVGLSAELGGKNAMIVAKSANIDRAATSAVRACFSNSGQLCVAIERIYVEEPVAAEFSAKFVAATAAMTLRAGYDFDIDMGSLISSGQVETMLKHVTDATSKGATVLTGGAARPDLGPLFFEPTVLTDVTDEMDCHRAETFGPLVSIYPVADVDAAVREANDTEYGLNASVWAGSRAEGEKIAIRLRTGSVNVNEGYAPAFATTAAPMGGVGTSGIGRRHGPDGLLKYTDAQTVASAGLSMDPPPFLTNEKWQNMLRSMVRAVRHLPGR